MHNQTGNYLYLYMAPSLLWNHNDKEVGGGLELKNANMPAAVAQAEEATVTQPRNGMPHDEVKAHDQNAKSPT